MHYILLKCATFSGIFFNAHEATHKKCSKRVTKRINNIKIASLSHG